MMAGTITHTYFSKDIYDKLDTNTKAIIENSKESFKTFNQGFDILFFAGKKYKKIGNYFHENKTQTFFVNLVNYIRKHNLKGNPEVMSFLYGFICHYSLDLNIHPYVIYKSGHFYKNDKKYHKYKGNHSEMESYIDAYLIEKNEKIKANTLDVGKFCFDYNNLSDELVELLNAVSFDTYNIKKIGNKYKKGLIRMKILYSLLRYDKKGRKKKLYNFLDNHFPNRNMKYSPISLDYKLNKNIFYLNTSHRKWCHPMDKKEIYKYSFDDIYKNSIRQAISLINVVNEVIYYNKTSNYLKKFFKDISLLSGKECSDKRKFKYFEFE